MAREELVAVKWDDGAWPICIESVSGIRIAYVTEGCESYAPLFAAAPNLLDALEAIVTLMPLADARWNFTPEYRDATAAIAKAKSEASS